jgi:hypothetical protein
MCPKKSWAKIIQKKRNINPRKVSYKYSNDYFIGTTINTPKIPFPDWAFKIVTNQYFLYTDLSVFKENRKVYGCIRLSRVLQNMGYPIGRTRTKRLMDECKIWPLTRKKFVKTTDSSHKKDAYPDFVNRDFSADAPNKIWTSDITYIWTLEGFVYLAVILGKRSANGYPTADQFCEGYKGV